MHIRPAQPADAAEWLRMRLSLYDDSSASEELSEIDEYFRGVILPTLHAAFVCERPSGGLCGLAEVSIRPYADGCDTNDVGYLEAWYVDDDMRGRGVGRALVAAAEAWAESNGCEEMASDTDLTNYISQNAHARLGYEEVGRIVQFCKRLDSPE